MQTKQDGMQINLIIPAIKTDKKKSGSLANV